MSVINTSGTFVLFFANLISKLFGAFYRLPLSNLLGAEGMGLYQMAFPIYSFLLTLITGGISITLTRKIATLRAKQNEVEIYKQYVLGKRTSMFFGIMFFMALLIFAYPIALLQGNLKAFYGYLAIAIGFVFACMLGAYRGYYQGYGNMIPTAISQVLEQSSKLVFGLVFAFLFLKQDAILGVFGALLGISVSEIISFIFFIFLNKKKVKKQQVALNKVDYINFIKQVFPVSITYVLLPLSSLIDSFLIVNLLSLSGFVTSFATSLYGIETGMILPLINMPNVLVSAFALESLPEISYRLSKNEDVTKQISLMFKIVLMFIVPCGIGMFILARPILNVIFPTLNENMLQIAVNLLKFSVFEMFFLSFITITNALMQALNKTKKSATSLLIGIVLKVIFTIIFVFNKSINIYGLVFASILCYFVASIINIQQIKKQTNFRLSFAEITSPLISGIIMAFVVLVFDYYFNLSKNILGLSILVMLAIITYFGLLISLRQIRFKDIKEMLSKNKQQN